MFSPRFIGALCLLLGWIVPASAQGPVLIKEVVSREYGVHVGGVQDPLIKEVVSREHSFFITGIP